MTTQERLERARKNGHPVDDLTGRKFNDYTIIEYLGAGKWLCRCKCGMVFKKNKYQLEKYSNTCNHRANANKIELMEEVVKMTQESVRREIALAKLEAEVERLRSLKGAEE